MRTIRGVTPPILAIAAAGFLLGLWWGGADRVAVQGSTAARVVGPRPTPTAPAVAAPTVTEPAGSDSLAFVAVTAVLAEDDDRPLDREFLAVYDGPDADSETAEPIPLEVEPGTGDGDAADR